jgi:hypothetical protein
LISTPGTGTPRLPVVGVAKCAEVASGAVSVEPHAEVKNTSARPASRAILSSRARVEGESAAAA